MKKVSIVVLHYRSVQYTIDCVQSIKKLQNSNEIDIVIVDNGSCDGTGEKLRERYSSDRRIHVVISKENLGFARGNNLGYFFAKNEIGSDYIIVINNDILFTQKNFVEKMLEFFEEVSFHILGPDVLNPVGQHQNPLRMKGYTLKQVYWTIIKKSLLYYYLWIKKTLHLQDKVGILEKMIEPRVKKRKDAIIRDEIQRGVVLQGACVVYSPLFVMQEEKAFSSETYMYGEEDILHYYCEKKGYDVWYNPKLQVYHLDGGTTHTLIRNSCEKELFFNKHVLDSLKVLCRMMKEQ